VSLWLRASHVVKSGAISPGRTLFLGSPGNSKGPRGIYERIAPCGNRAGQVCRRRRRSGGFRPPSRPPGPL
jgi:hypothetical protein